LADLVRAHLPNGSSAFKELIVSIEEVPQSASHLICFHAVTEIHLCFCVPSIVLISISECNALSSIDQGEP
jgi:hypothetical protein